MRNRQNKVWKWNGNLYNINKIQYTPTNKGGSGHRAVVQERLATPKKKHGPRQHSPKKEKLRRHAITLNPPRMVKACGDGP